MIRMFDFGLFRVENMLFLLSLQLRQSLSDMAHTKNFKKFYNFFQIRTYGHY